MKALIVGAGGFVGDYLINELAENRGWTVVATKLPSEKISAPDCSVRNLDILSESDILALLSEVRPDVIFHLAAQSSVALSWENPALTIDVNIKGSVNLLEAVRKSSLSPRILMIGSGEEYGYAADVDGSVDENVPPDPGNIYAVTKMTQNITGRLYYRAYGMDIINVRAFNHIGPGQSPRFVVSGFCKQAADIEKGVQESVIHVGNIEVYRDFTDVRDIVRAYADLAERGESGQTYNVGSGKAVKLGSILDIICKRSRAAVSVEVDENRFRPADIPRIQADISKITSHTEWRPVIPLETSVEDILNYWRG